MESAAQTCARLVIALEDLAAQEALALQGRDFAAAIEIQERAAPLVQHLVAHADDVVDPQVRERIGKIRAQRHRSGEWLAEQIEQTRRDLAEMHASRRRVAQIAPAYGRGGAAAHARLSAVG